MTRAFADRLIDGVRREGPLCVGIDPHPGKLPALFGSPHAGSIAIWASAIAEIASQHVAVVKPQVALYERWGSAGFAALERVAKTARDAGSIVIMDAKRGDIGSTALGYSDAYLGPDAAIPCDALTIAPYMGLDTIEPFVAAAEQTGRGVVVLARTSNPGAADFQSLESDGKPVYLHVTEQLQTLSKRLEGENGWSGLTLVVGATAPEEARRIRAAAPNNLFLVPGYGTQSGHAEGAMSGFVDTDRGLEGGVVNASRSVTFPPAAQEATTVAEWESAIHTAIKSAKDDLAHAANPA